MTIGEALRGQLRITQVVALVFWLVAVLCSASGLPLSNFVVIPAIGFGAAVLYLGAAIRCPKCGARVGQTMMATKTYFCPNCGVSFNTQLSA